MSNSLRNTIILEKIIDYCNDVDEFIEQYGNTYEALIGNKSYKYSISLCILQIGELADKLTDSFKEKYANVPWLTIKNMRNIVAHEYEKFDYEIVWETMQLNIPELRDYCQVALKQLQQEGEN